MQDSSRIWSIWDKQWRHRVTSAVSPVHERYAIEGFRVIESLIAPSATHVLEVGCGTGRFCEMLSTSRPSTFVVGLDPAPNAGKVHAARSTIGSQRVRFVRGTAAALPFADATFDAVFSEGVVSLFEDRGLPPSHDIVAEMARVVRPGGSLIIAVPNWWCLPHTIYKWVKNLIGAGYEYGFEKSYTATELEALFRRLRFGHTESRGFYAAHAMFRLAHYWRGFSYLGRIIDRCDRGRISGKFGFYIVASGKKVAATLEGASRHCRPC